MREELQTQNYLLWVMVAGSPVAGFCAETRNPSLVTITRNR